MTTKDTIRSEALRLFSRRGYASVGIQEIADASGITKPSLYHHFGSKAGLFEEILEHHHAPFISSLSAASGYTHDLADTLNSVFSVYLRAAQHDPDFFMMKLSLDFIPHDSEIHPYIRRYNEKIFSLVEKVFIAAAKDHGNMKGRQRLYAASFIGLCHTYASMLLNGYFKPEEKQMRDAVKFFMHGIFS